jgi:hypothetical protein
MSRGALGPAIAFVALVGATGPVASLEQSREITLPRLEVPDEVKARRAPPNPDRAALLNQPIELSDERDRLTLARERAAWGRLSGSLCSGCGEYRSQHQAGTVDPIAVLNAKPAAARLPVKPLVRPTAVATVRTAPVPALAAATPAPIAARPGAVLVAATSAPAAAKLARPRATAAPRRSARPAHTHRVQLAHRRGSRSKLTGYLGRIRYALLRWRHRHPHRIHRIHPPHR